MEPIDRAALRALAAAVESDEAANTCGRYRCGFCGQCRSYAASRVRRLDAQEKVLAGRGPAGWIATRDLTALLDALDAAEREADRWRHGVPVEGDYVCPTSLALDQARADLRAYGGHRDDCHIAIWMRCADEPPAPACTCGYSEALARAEGR